MPCLIGCIALAFPRVALFLVWLFGGGYLGRAYEHWIFPLLGFFFLPLTTLAFAFGMNTLGSPTQMEPLGWLLVVIAAAADLGLIGRGAKDAQGWRERDRDGWRRPSDW
jgi:hypothetical protein